MLEKLDYKTVGAVHKRLSVCCQGELSSAYIFRTRWR